MELLLFVLALALRGDENEAAVAEAIKNGDEQAFRTFFNAHHRSLYLYLVQRGMSGSAAEDLIQQAFLYIWENRSQIDASKSLRAYLFRIGYTRMLNHFRDHQRIDQDADFELTASSDARTDQPVQEREVFDAVEQAIANLPEKRRMIFELCFKRELTYKEAAEIAGVSVKTVENHMGLAFKDLRKALAYLRE